MQDHPDRDTWNKWKRDPSKWVWGIFYFNRQDPRLFAPKRIEWMGFTINFAHPLARLVFTLLVLGIVLISALPFMARVFSGT